MPMDQGRSGGRQPSERCCPCLAAVNLHHLATYPVAIGLSEVTVLGRRQRASVGPLCSQLGQFLIPLPGTTVAGVQASGCDPVLHLQKQPSTASNPGIAGEEVHETGLVVCRAGASCLVFRAIRPVLPRFSPMRCPRVPAISRESGMEESKQAVQDSCSRISPATGWPRPCSP